MKAFLQSGGLFVLVAVICFVAAMVSENGGVFTSLGAFWVIMAAVARARYGKKSAVDGDEGHQ